MQMMLPANETTYPWIRDVDLFAGGRMREDLLLLDVRTPGEFGEVHVPNSTNVPLADLPHHLPELKFQAKEKTVVLLCRTQNRVKVAYDQLQEAGIINCQILEGGITAWKDAGHPVVRGRKAISLERQVRMTVGSLVVVGVILGAVVSPWYLLLPGAVGAGLLHAGLTDSCLMAILLAKLPFNRGTQGMGKSVLGRGSNMDQENVPENRAWDGRSS